MGQAPFCHENVSTTAFHNQYKYGVLGVCHAKPGTHKHGTSKSSPTNPCPLGTYLGVGGTITTEYGFSTSVPLQPND